jgi:peptide-methionine (S)-S-oxide reductase
MQKILLSLSVVLGVLSCGFSNQSDPSTRPSSANQEFINMQTASGMSVATFGAGCFWCVEAVFQAIRGVDTVLSGYMGGKIPNPTYREVCSGRTGHAEVVQVYYRPEQISFEALLEVFWKTHDPTSLNRQGADVGTQYRSAVFYHNLEQKKLAEQLRDQLNDAGAFEKPIVTEISPATTFYEAEAYHQNYYRANGDQPYCQFVIRPKMDKLERVFREYLK